MYPYLLSHLGRTRNIENALEYEPVRNIDFSQIRVVGDNYVDYDENGDMIVVSNKTGLVKKAQTFVAPVDVSIETEEVRENKKAWWKKQEEQRHATRQINKLGSYIFVSKEPQSFEGLTPAALARLLYLTTHLQYQTGKLLLHKKGKIPMKKEHLTKVLRLRKSAVNKFWKEVYPRFLREDDDGTLLADGNIFIRGSIGNHYSSYVKFYDKGYRRVYEQTDSRQHKHLGYVLKLLPYVHIETNVLCYSPQEGNMDRVQYLNLTDFCKENKLNPSHGNRIVETYNGIKLKVLGVKEPFCWFIRKEPNSKNVRIQVNPNVLYSGKNLKHVEEFREFYS